VNKGTLHSWCNNYTHDLYAHDYFIIDKLTTHCTSDYRRERLLRLLCSEKVTGDCIESKGRRASKMLPSVHCSYNSDLKLIIIIMQKKLTSFVSLRRKNLPKGNFLELYLNV
jgi:hypothetical protein